MVGATPPLAAQAAPTMHSEYPPLVPIVLVYLPSKADYISDCGVQNDLRCIDAALISFILYDIYFPSFLQSDFSQKVSKLKSILIEEFVNAKQEHKQLENLIENTEKRFLQKGYIPYLLHQVQKRVRQETKKIVSGKIMTEQHCLLLTASHFASEDLSFVPDKKTFFCDVYQASADETMDIQYLKETMSFTPGKRPSTYVLGILKGLKKQLDFCKVNSEKKAISECCRRVERFENNEYLESLIVKLQLQK